MLGGGKSKVAVNRVSFGVAKGECFGLMGVNGAGKIFIRENWSFVHKFSNAFD